MDQAMLSLAVKCDRRPTTKISNTLEVVTCCCLLLFSHTTFAQQLETKQINQTNQLAQSPNRNLDAIQASANPPRKFDPPYPYTSNQLKEMLLKVASLESASKDGTEILQIFNLPIDEFINIKPKDLSIKEKGFSLSSPNDWYFLMAYRSIEEAKIAHFAFGWLDDPSARRITNFPQPPSGLCIPSEKMTDVLENNGWHLKEKRELDAAPPHKIYLKNDSLALKIYFSRWDNCFLQIDVWWATNDFVKLF